MGRRQWQSKACGTINKQVGYFLLLPALVVIVSVVFYPLSYSLWVILHNLNLKRPWVGIQFVGVKNFSKMFSDYFFWNSIKNTLLFVSASISLVFTIGLGIALLLNQDFKGKWIIMVLLLVPWALPPVANAIMWKQIFDSNYGPLNGALFQIGLISSYKRWLADPNTAMLAVIIARVWQTTPFVTLLLLAKLQAIPKDLYDAAKIDGAGIWRAFYNITFPLLKLTMMIALILTTIWTFNVFDLIYVLTGGGPARATEVFVYFVYFQTFNLLNHGYGAALSYFLAFMTLLFALIYIKLFYKEVEA